MEKIIFLDIDGVLNSSKWFKKAKKRAMSGEKFDYDLDPEAVKLLMLVKETIPSVKIVISSTWRFDGLFAVAKRLYDIGLKIEIIDTISLDKHESSGLLIRGILIKEWLVDYMKTHPTVNYVIVDDDIDMLYEQKDNFINTNHLVGITKKDIKAIIRILGED